jgi:tripartite ATP-independent transporter DctM subunit
VQLVLISLAILIVVLMIGVPVPFAFFAASLSIVFLGGYDFRFLPAFGYAQVGSIILIAIPLFILAGYFMERGGIGEALINFVETFMGRIKGGLGAVMVVACAIFGSISGSGFATLSCIGAIMLPRMYAAGYPRGHCAALVSSAALMSLLIPPSLNQILFAWVGGQSVLACFMSTLVPGLILVVLFSGVNFWLLRNNKDIILPPPLPKEGRREIIAKRVLWVLPAMGTPIIILGGIYGGFMTPTEAAAVAIIYALPISVFVYKGLNSIKIVLDCTIKAVTTAGVIMLMLFSVMMMSRLFIMENLPQMIMDFLYGISDSPMVLIIFVNLFMILIGMIMDDTSAILLTTPILLPVVIELGIHPIHFAAILGVNIGMGCVMPPTAPFLFLGSRVGEVPVTKMLGPSMWLLLFAWLPTLILTTYIPSLSLALPRAMGLV